MYLVVFVIVESKDLISLQITADETSPLWDPKNVAHNKNVALRSLICSSTSIYKIRAMRNNNIFKNITRINVTAIGPTNDFLHQRAEIAPIR